MTNTDRLVKEIQRARNTLINHIDTREYHPTYGITKTVLRDDLKRLQGLVEAWLYVTETWDHAGTVLWSQETNDKVAAALRVDIHGLHKQVKEA